MTPSEGRPRDSRRRWAGLRDRTTDGTLAATSSDPGIAWLAVTAALLVAWVLSYAAGGSKTAVPHLFYVPVVLVGIRFGPRSAFIVALGAGLAAGPLLPLDVDEGSSQSLANWTARLAAFLLLGQLTAVFSRRSLPSLREEIAARRARSELLQGLAAGELRLEYQPIVDLQLGAVAGVEALVRWDHPTRGLVPPDEFIPLAERSGAIGHVTRFVVHEACAQVGRWKASGLELGEGFILAVNVSAVDLSDDQLPGIVRDALAASGLDASSLHLEVTETALVEDLAVAVMALDAVKQLGVRVAIDDFGTGESSLSQLAQLPVDVLKLDQTVIAQLAQHPRGTELTNGIVALAHAIGLDTVAEGIETTAQAIALRASGCRFAQGYLFSRPLRPDALADLLRTPEQSRAANLALLEPAAIGR